MPKKEKQSEATAAKYVANKYGPGHPFIRGLQVAGAWLSGKKSGLPASEIRRKWKAKEAAKPTSEQKASKARKAVTPATVKKRLTGPLEGVRKKTKKKVGG